MNKRSPAQQRQDTGASLGALVGIFIGGASGWLAEGVLGMIGGMIAGAFFLAIIGALIGAASMAFVKVESIADEAEDEHVDGEEEDVDYGGDGENVDDEEEEEDEGAETGSWECPRPDCRASNEARARFCRMCGRERRTPERV